MNSLNEIKSKYKFMLEILVLLVLSRFLFLFVAILYDLFNEPQPFFNLLFRWDSAWYNDIIENGYALEPSKHPNGDAANWAFFPLYPLIIKCFKILSFNKLSVPFLGFFVSNICIYITGLIGYLYVYETRQEKNLILPFLLFFAPYTFYFSCLYTESLFIMLVSLTFYFTKKHKYLLASIFSALASGTRSIGVFLVFVLIIEMYLEQFDKINLKNLKDFILDLLKNPMKILSLILCPFGFFSYMLYLYIHVGDAWAMSHIEIAWGREIGNPLSVIFKSYKISNFRKFQICFVFIFLFLSLFNCSKQKISEVFFFLLTVILPISTSLDSIQRYIMGTFVAELVLFDILSKKQQYKNIIFCLFILVEMFLVYLWFTNNPIMI